MTKQQYLKEKIVDDVSNLMKIRRGAILDHHFFYGMPVSVDDLKVKVVFYLYDVYGIYDPSYARDIYRRCYIIAKNNGRTN
jgi:hypothetical protein